MARGILSHWLRVYGQEGSDHLVRERNLGLQSCYFLFSFSESTLCSVSHDRSVNESSVYYINTPSWKDQPDYTWIDEEAKGPTFKQYASDFSRWNNIGTWLNIQ